MANSHQTLPAFPPLPLKFRTVGFPQYRLQTGSRRDHLHTSQALIDRHCVCSPNVAFYSVIGSWPNRHHVLLITPPVQWPLAPQSVLLSDRLIAYYGHIRVSESAHWLMVYSRCVLLLSELPQFTLRLFQNVSHSLPRRMIQVHVTASSPDLKSLRHLLRGSASALSCSSERQVRLTRLQVSLYATTRSFASPAPPGRLQSGSRRGRSLSHDADHH